MEDRYSVIFDAQLDISDVSISSSETSYAEVAAALESDANTQGISKAASRLGEKAGEALQGGLKKKLKDISQLVNAELNAALSNLDDGALDRTLHLSEGITRKLKDDLANVPIGFKLDNLDDIKRDLGSFNIHADMDEETKAALKSIQALELSKGKTLKFKIENADELQRILKSIDAVVNIRIDQNDLKGIVTSAEQAGVQAAKRTAQAFKSTLKEQLAAVRFRVNVDANVSSSGKTISGGVTGVDVSGNQPSSSPAGNIGQVARNVSREAANRGTVNHYQARPVGGRMQDLVVLDTETSGLSRKSQVLSYASARLDADGRIQHNSKSHLLVQPYTPIHPAAQSKHKLDAATLNRTGLPPAEAARQLHAQMLESARAGKVFTAYNAKFDVDKLFNEFHRHKIDYRELQQISRWVDAQDVVKSMYAGQANRPANMKLETVAAFEGLDTKNSHNAITDVAHTARLLHLARQRNPNVYMPLRTVGSRQKNGGFSLVDAGVDAHYSEAGLSQYNADQQELALMREMQDDAWRMNRNRGSFQHRQTVPRHLLNRRKYQGHLLENTLGNPLSTYDYLKEQFDPKAGIPISSNNKVVTIPFEEFLDGIHGIGVEGGTTNPNARMLTTRPVAAAADRIKLAKRIGHSGWHREQLTLTKPGDSILEQGLVRQTFLLDGGPLADGMGLIRDDIMVEKDHEMFFNVASNSKKIGQNEISSDAGFRVQAGTVINPGESLLVVDGSTKTIEASKAPVTVMAVEPVLDADGRVVQQRVVYRTSGTPDQMRLEAKSGSDKSTLKGSDFRDINIIDNQGRNITSSVHMMTALSKGGYDTLALEHAYAQPLSELRKFPGLENIQDHSDLNSLPREVFGWYANKFAGDMTTVQQSNQIHSSQLVPFLREQFGDYDTQEHRLIERAMNTQVPGMGPMVVPVDNTPEMYTLRRSMRGITQMVKRPFTEAFPISRARLGRDALNAIRTHHPALADSLHNMGNRTRRAGITLLESQLFNQYGFDPANVTDDLKFFDMHDPRFDLRAVTDRAAELLGGHYPEGIPEQVPDNIRTNSFLKAMDELTPKELRGLSMSVSDGAGGHALLPSLEAMLHFGTTAATDDPDGETARASTKLSNRYRNVLRTAQVGEASLPHYLSEFHDSVTEAVAGEKFSKSVQGSNIDPSIFQGDILRADPRLSTTQIYAPNVKEPLVVFHTHPLRPDAPMFEMENVAVTQPGMFTDDDTGIHINQVIAEQMHRDFDSDLGNVVGLRGRDWVFGDYQTHLSRTGLTASDLSEGDWARARSRQNDRMRNYQDEIHQMQHDRYRRGGSRIASSMAVSMVDDAQSIERLELAAGTGGIEAAIRNSLLNPNEIPLTEVANLMYGFATAKADIGPIYNATKGRLTAAISPDVFHKDFKPTSEQEALLDIQSLIFDTTYGRAQVPELQSEASELLLSVLGAGRRYLTAESGSVSGLDGLRSQAAAIKALAWEGIYSPEQIALATVGEADRGWVREMLEAENAAGRDWGKTSPTEMGTLLQPEGEDRLTAQSRLARDYQLNTMIGRAATAKNLQRALEQQQKHATDDQEINIQDVISNHIRSNQLMFGTGEDARAAGLSMLENYETVAAKTLADSKSTSGGRFDIQGRVLTNLLSIASQEALSGDRTLLKSLGTFIPNLAPQGAVRDDSLLGISMKSGFKNPVRDVPVLQKQIREVREAMKNLEGVELADAVVALNDMDLLSEDILLGIAADLEKAEGAAPETRTGKLLDNVRGLMDMADESLKREFNWTTDTGAEHPHGGAPGAPKPGGPSSGTLFSTWDQFMATGALDKHQLTNMLAAFHASDDKVAARQIFNDQLELALRQADGDSRGEAAAAARILADNIMQNESFAAAQGIGLDRQTVSSYTGEARDAHARRVDNFLSEAFGEENYRSAFLSNARGFELRKMLMDSDMNFEAFDPNVHSRLAGSLTQAVSAVNPSEVEAALEDVRAQTRGNVHMQRQLASYREWVAAPETYSGFSSDTRTASRQRLQLRRIQRMATPAQHEILMSGTPEAQGVFTRLADRERLMDDRIRLVQNAMSNSAAFMISNVAMTAFSHVAQQAGDYEAAVKSAGALANLNPNERSRDWLVARSGQLARSLGTNRQQILDLSQQYRTSAPGATASELMEIMKEMQGVMRATGESAQELTAFVSAVNAADFDDPSDLANRVVSRGVTLADAAAAVQALGPSLTSLDAQAAADIVVGQANLNMTLSDNAFVRDQQLDRLQAYGESTEAFASVNESMGAFEQVGAKFANTIENIWQIVRPLLELLARMASVLLDGVNIITNLVNMAGPVGRLAAQFTLLAAAVVATAGALKGLMTTQMGSRMLDEARAFISGAAGMFRGFRETSTRVVTSVAGNLAGGTKAVGGRVLSGIMGFFAPGLLSRLSEAQAGNRNLGIADQRGMRMYEALSGVGRRVAGWGNAWWGDKVDAHGVTTRGWGGRMVDAATSFGLDTRDAFNRRRETLRNMWTDASAAGWSSATQARTLTGGVFRGGGTTLASLGGSMLRGVGSTIGRTLTTLAPILGTLAVPAAIIGTAVSARRRFLSEKPNLAISRELFGTTSSGLSVAGEVNPHRVVDLADAYNGNLTPALEAAGFSAEEVKKKIDDMAESSVNRIRKLGQEVQALAKHLAGVGQVIENYSGFYGMRQETLANTWINEGLGVAEMGSNLADLFRVYDPNPVNAVDLIQDLADRPRNVVSPIVSAARQRAEGEYQALETWFQNNDRASAGVDLYEANLDRYAAASSLKHMTDDQLAQYMMYVNVGGEAPGFFERLAGVTKDNFFLDLAQTEGISERFDALLGITDAERITLFDHQSTVRNLETQLSGLLGDELVQMPAFQQAFSAYGTSSTSDGFVKWLEGMDPTRKWADNYSTQDLIDRIYKIRPYGVFNLAGVDDSELQYLSIGQAAEQARNQFVERMRRPVEDGGGGIGNYVWGATSMLEGENRRLFQEAQAEILRQRKEATGEIHRNRLQRIEMEMNFGVGRWGANQSFEDAFVAIAQGNSPLLSRASWDSTLVRDQQTLIQEQIATINENMVRFPLAGESWSSLARDASGMIDYQDPNNIRIFREGLGLDGVNYQAELESLMKEYEENRKTLESLTAAFRDATRTVNVFEAQLLEMGGGPNSVSPLGILAGFDIQSGSVSPVRTWVDSNRSLLDGMAARGDRNRVGNWLDEITMPFGRPSTFMVDQAADIIDKELLTGSRAVNNIRNNRIQGTDANALLNSTLASMRDRFSTNQMTPNQARTLYNLMTGSNVSTQDYSPEMWDRYFSQMIGADAAFAQATQERHSLLGSQNQANLQGRLQSMGTGTTFGNLSASTAGNALERARFMAEQQQVNIAANLALGSFDLAAQFADELDTGELAIKYGQDSFGFNVAVPLISDPNRRAEYQARTQAAQAQAMSQLAQTDMEQTLALEGVEMERIQNQIQNATNMLGTFDSSVIEAGMLQQMLHSGVSSGTIASVNQAIDNARRVQEREMVSMSLANRDMALQFVDLYQGFSGPASSRTSEQLRSQFIGMTSQGAPFRDRWGITTDALNPFAQLPGGPGAAEQMYLQQLAFDEVMDRMTQSAYPMTLARSWLSASPDAFASSVITPEYLAEAEAQFNAARDDYVTNVSIPAALALGQDVSDPGVRAQLLKEAELQVLGSDAGQNYAAAQSSLFQQDRSRLGMQQQWQGIMTQLLDSTAQFTYSNMLENLDLELDQQRMLDPESEVVRNLSDARDLLEANAEGLDIAFSEYNQAIRDTAGLSPANAQRMAGIALDDLESSLRERRVSESIIDNLLGEQLSKLRYQRQELEAQLATTMLRLGLEKEMLDVSIARANVTVNLSTQNQAALEVASFNREAAVQQAGATRTLALDALKNQMRNDSFDTDAQAWAFQTQQMENIQRQYDLSITEADNQYSQQLTQQLIQGTSNYLNQFESRDDRRSTLESIMSNPALSGVDKDLLERPYRNWLAVAEADEQFGDILSQANRTLSFGGTLTDEQLTSLLAATSGLDAEQFNFTSNLVNQALASSETIRLRNIDRTRDPARTLTEQLNQVLEDIAYYQGIGGGDIHDRALGPTMAGLLASGDQLREQLRLQVGVVDPMNNAAVARRLADAEGLGQADQLSNAQFELNKLMTILGTEFPEVAGISIERLQELSSYSEKFNQKFGEGAQVLRELTDRIATTTEEVRKLEVGLMQAGENVAVVAARNELQDRLRFLGSAAEVGTAFTGVESELMTRITNRLGIKPGDERFDDVWQLARNQDIEALTGLVTPAGQEQHAETAALVVQLVGEFESTREQHINQVLQTTQADIARSVSEAVRTSGIDGLNAELMNSVQVAAQAGLAQAEALLPEGMTTSEVESFRDQFRAGMGIQGLLAGFFNHELQPDFNELNLAVTQDDFDKAEQLSDALQASLMSFLRTMLGVFNPELLSEFESGGLFNEENSELAKLLAEANGLGSLSDLFNVVPDLREQQQGARANNLQQEIRDRYARLGGPLYQSPQTNLAWEMNQVQEQIAEVEKLLVFNEDGSLDPDANSREMIEMYNRLIKDRDKLQLDMEFLFEREFRSLVNDVLNEIKSAFSDTLKLMLSELVMRSAAEQRAELDKEFTRDVSDAQTDLDQARARRDMYRDRMNNAPVGSSEHTQAVEQFKFYVNEVERLELALRDINREWDTQIDKIETMGEKLLDIIKRLGEAVLNKAIDFAVDWAFGSVMNLLGAGSPGGDDGGSGPSDWVNNIFGGGGGSAGSTSGATSSRGPGRGTAPAGAAQKIGGGVDWAGAAVAGSVAFGAGMMSDGSPSQVPGGLTASLGLGLTSLLMTGQIANPVAVAAVGLGSALSHLITTVSWYNDRLKREAQADFVGGSDYGLNRFGDSSRAWWSPTSAPITINSVNASVSDLSGFHASRQIANAAQAELKMATMAAGIYNG